MQTVLFVSTMTLGNEHEVRQIHERFPIEALERGAGVTRVTAFLGSGFYALELTVEGETREFQSNFHTFVQTPEVQQIFEELRAHVDELPAPADETGHLHLATPLFHWERGANG